MAAIRAKHTQPELRVGRVLRALGYKFRLHVRSLPGCPDIVLGRHRKIIQVKGCFWHGHRCLKGRLPKTNRSYWVPKLKGNKRRDITNERKLRRMGWSVRSIWECRMKKMDSRELVRHLANLLKR